MAKGSNSQITNQNLGEAVDAILKGIDLLLKDERKYNTQTFASKEDLSKEVGWIRDDVNGLKVDLVDTVSKNEFTKLKTKVDKYLVE